MRLAADRDGSIRLLAVKACLKVIRRLPNGEKLPIIKKLMPSFKDDDAWVRRWLALKITIIQKAAGKDFTNAYLIDVYRALLTDSDVNVKKAAASSYKGVVRLIDVETLSFIYLRAADPERDPEDFSCLLS